MRRMMHAAMFFLVSASLLQAQTPGVKPLPPQPTASRSVLALSAEVHDDAEVAQDVKVATSTPPSPQANPVSFIPRDSGRPYSQIASFMSCSDWSPSLWNGYSCERAARVAAITQHVDMQCHCFESKKNCLHLHASACGIDGCSAGDCSCGACKGKAGAKLVNRYRQSMSTLHDVPCESAGTTCGSTCTATANCNTEMVCGPKASGISTLYQASQTPPVPNMRPNTLLANPVINPSRSAMNPLEAYPKMNGRR